MLTRRMRYRTRRIYVVKKTMLIFIGILCVCIVMWKYNAFLEEGLPVSTNLTWQQEQSEMLHWPKWRDVLFSGVPQLATAANSQEVVSAKPDGGTKQVLREAIRFFTNVDIKDLRSLIQVEIPVLAAVKTESQAVSATNLPNFPKFEMISNLSNGKPLVGIYHTHTAESFVPSSGVTHSPGGQRGDIVGVGDALAKRLNMYGIGTLQSNAIHDYPSFMKAYGASEITVKKMLAENPSLQMIFDIHRDAEKRENYIATVDGTPVARMTIIVATGQPDLIQPHWQQNHAFAKLIDAKLNQRYPGVSRGIRLDDFRYNQHLHPRALLIEVGCQENTKEEAQRGIELLGDIIAEIMAENNKQ